MRSAWLIPLVALAVVMVRVKGAAAPALGRPTVGNECLDIAASIAAQEADWRARAEASFPEDAWSQRDHFHALESQYAREVATARKIPIEEVLRAVDEDLHREPSDRRNAQVVPCKPRPFYD